MPREARHAIRLVPLLEQEGRSDSGAKKAFLVNKL